jgi:NitT/TauT family transport system substrate-binding protein
MRFSPTTTFGRLRWLPAVAAGAALALVLAACGGSSGNSSAESSGSTTPPSSAQGSGQSQPAESSATATTDAETDEPEPQETVSIRYGMLKSVSPIFLSIDNGYFSDEGLDVSVEFMQSGSDLTPLLASGEFQAGESSAAAGLFNALARDVDVRIVADDGQLKPDTGVAAMMVRQDLLDSGEITSLADLKGRTIAVTAEGSAMNLLVVQALEKIGMKTEDVSMVTLAFPAMLAALASKDVDAAMLTEPFITQAIGDGLASILVPGHELEPDGQQVVVMFSPDLVGDQELGTRFMRAWLRGVQDYIAAFGPDRVGRDAAVASLSKHLDMDAAVIEAGLPKGLSQDGAVNLDSLAARQQFFVDHGQVPEPVDLESVVDSGPREAALADLGL